MFGNVYSQGLDSLNALLQKAEHDSVKVRLLLEMGDEIFYQVPDSALTFWTEAKAVAESNIKQKDSGPSVKVFKKRLGECLHFLGSYYHGQGVIDKALDNYERALELRRETGDRLGEAHTLNDLGFVYKGLGDIPKAMEFYENSLRIYEEVGDKGGIANIHNKMGVVYYRKGDTPKALEYFSKSLKVLEELDEKQGMAGALSNMAFLSDRLGHTEKALEYYHRGLEIFQEIDNKKGIATALNNLGAIHVRQKNNELGLDYYNRSLKLREEVGDQVGVANSLNNIGDAYLSNGEISKALDFHNRSLAIREKIGNKVGIVFSLNNIASVHIKQKQYQKAEQLLKRSLEISQELGYPEEIKNAANKLYELYTKIGKYDMALDNYKLYVQMRDTVNNIEAQKAAIEQQTKYEYEKRELAIKAEQEKKDAIAEEELHRQKLVRNGFVGGFAIMLLFAGIFFTQRNRIKAGKKQSDELLLNILPEETAKELKEKGHADAKQFDQVTVLFTDFKGFTQISERLSPSELVAAIDECFKAFDEIIGKYNIEKIKTIGDAYMAAGGLPVPNRTNPEDVVNAALEMREWMLAFKQRKGENGFEIRIGVHTGPVVAGIVGTTKFQYDIWGDTVNTASRMESSGEVSKINISEKTYELIKDKFTCEYRGEIEAKGKGKVKMYFVETSKV